MLFLDCHTRIWHFKYWLRKPSFLPSKISCHTFEWKMCLLYMYAVSLLYLFPNTYRHYVFLFQIIGIHKWIQRGIFILLKRQQVKTNCEAWNNLTLEEHDTGLFLQPTGLIQLPLCPDPMDLLLWKVFILLIWIHLESFSYILCIYTLMFAFHPSATVKAPLPVPPQLLAIAPKLGIEEQAPNVLRQSMCSSYTTSVSHKNFNFILTNHIVTVSCSIVLR